MLNQNQINSLIKRTEVKVKSLQDEIISSFSKKLIHSNVISLEKQRIDYVSRLNVLKMIDNLIEQGARDVEDLVKDFCNSKIETLLLDKTITEEEDIILKAEIKTLRVILELNRF